MIFFIFMKLVDLSATKQKRHIAEPNGCAKVRILNPHIDQSPFRSSKTNVYGNPALIKDMIQKNQETYSGLNDYTTNDQSSRMPIMESLLKDSSEATNTFIDHGMNMQQKQLQMGNEDEPKRVEQNVVHDEAYKSYGTKYKYADSSNVLQRMKKIDSEPEVKEAEHNDKLPVQKTCRTIRVSNAFTASQILEYIAALNHGRINN